MDLGGSGHRQLSGVRFLFNVSQFRSGTDVCLWAAFLTVPLYSLWLSLRFYAPWRRHELVSTTRLPPNAVNIYTYHLAPLGGYLLRWMGVQPLHWIEVPEPIRYFGCRWCLCCWSNLQLVRQVFQRKRLCDHGVCICLRVLFSSLTRRCSDHWYPLPTPVRRSQRRIVHLRL